MIEAEAVRKVIYATNAIDCINASLRKVTKKRGAFPTPESVRKVLCPAVIRASEEWARPAQNRARALNHFSNTFDGRVPV